MNIDETIEFRRQAASALMHPVTLVALAVLLANDLLFKALWPGAWIPGKLSDLAWMMLLRDSARFEPWQRLQGDASGTTAIMNVTVRVIDVNERPEKKSDIPDQMMTASVFRIISLQGTFSDPDGDTLTYSASTSASGIATASVNNRDSTLTIAALAAGMATITVTAADRAPGHADRLTISQNFTVTVEPPELPTVTIARHMNTPASVTEGGQIRFTLTASSAPTADLTVNVTVTETDPHLAGRISNFVTGNIPSEITIAVGTTTSDLILDTEDDTLDETDVGTLARVEVGAGYTVGPPSVAVVTIEDNDLPPGAPTGLRANGHLDSDGNVKLRWDAVDGATGYNVRYAEEVCMQTDIDYDDNGTNEVLCDLGSPPLWTTIMEQDITTEELTINGATVLETSLNFTPPDPIRNPVIFNTLNILAFPSVPWPLYRVEVRAVVADSSEWSDFVLVFPTAEPPGVDARFATYHQNDHVDATNGSHEYGYTICKGTITTEVAWGWSTDVQGELVRDDDTVTAIAADIEAAIEKWETVVRWVTSGANIVSTTATVSETCPEDDAVQFIPDGEVEEFCTRSDALGCQPPNTFSMFLRHNPEMRESSGKIELTSWDAMSNGCSYLHKIVMHEAGHVFGLAHPQTPQAAMFRSTSGWQDSFCEPQIYDILAMMANYQSR